METVLAPLPLWLTYIVVTNPAFEAWVRRSSLLSWINPGGELTLQARLGAIALIIFLVSLVVTVWFGRKLNRWAFDPQIKEQLFEWQVTRLTEIARSLKPGRLIDPDYRVTGWNQSKYAPKNADAKKGSPMRARARQAGTLFGGIAFLIGLSTEGLTIGTFLLSLTVMGLFTAYVAANIRRKEWQRIKPLVLQSMPLGDSLGQPKYTSGGVASWMPAPQYQRGTGFEFDLSSPTAYRDFEREVAYLIHKQTGLRTEVVGGAGDQGIDIKVFNGERLVGIVQCKNYAPNAILGPNLVREMIGVKHVVGVKTAYLVTSGRFSEGAKHLARQHNIKLLDGSDLAEIRARGTAYQAGSLNGMWDEPSEQTRRWSDEQRSR